MHRMASLLTTHSYLLTIFSTPSPAKLVPSPYKQGESASGLGNIKEGVPAGTPSFISTILRVLKNYSAPGRWM